MQQADPSQLPPEKPETDPVQIFQALERQLAAQKRARPPANSRAAFRFGSLAGIIAFTIFALLVLQWMISQLPKPVPHDRRVTQEHAEP